MLSFNSLNAWMDNKRLKFQKMPTSFVAVQKISVWNSLKSPIYSLKEVLRNSYFKRIFKKSTFGCKDKSVLNLYLCHVLLFKKLNKSLKHNINFYIELLPLTKEMFILASVNWVHIDNFWRQRNRKKNVLIKTTLKDMLRNVMKKINKKLDFNYSSRLGGKKNFRFDIQHLWHHEFGFEEDFKSRYVEWAA